MNKIETGFIKNKLNKLADTIEIPDEKCKNSHKSHRLLLVDKCHAKNEGKWNYSWTKEGKLKSYYNEV